MSRLPMHRWIVGLTVVGCCTILLSNSALAQYQKKPAPKLTDLPAEKMMGEVKGKSGNAIMVGDATKAYYVQVTRDTKKVDVTGDGEVSMLQPGMFIRFDIKMDKQGNGKEDVTKIELFTPDQAARTGSDDKGDESYTIAGRIKSINKTGKMSVEVPGEKLTVKAQLSKDATVDLAVRGDVWLKLAKNGDGITVTGRVAKPAAGNTAGVLIAEEIELKVNKQLEDTFGKPEKKTPEKKVVEKKMIEKKVVEKKLPKKEN